MIKAISNTAYGMLQKQVATMKQEEVTGLLAKAEIFLPLLQDDSVSLDDFILRLQNMVNEWNNQNQEKIN